MTKIQLFKPDGREPGCDPLHYTACGLDDVYLVNGFSREVVDGEEYITVEDMDSLWKAIGLTLVTTKKVLAPKELRFLRDHMNLTQAELSVKLRVSDQTVARWEKGESQIPGPADLMIRVWFLACERAQPEGNRILDDLAKHLNRIIKQDEVEPRPVVFKHRARKWSEDKHQLQAA